MVVDDHAVVRSGLVAFLLAFDDLTVVGEAGNGEEALRMCAEAQPDVVLMDLVMPGMDGAATTLAMREGCPTAQVIALTSYKDEELVKKALEAGAIGYLLKNVSAEELADAVADLLTHPDRRRQMGAAARETIRRMQGATARTIDLVREALGT